ncbi:DUF6543 domain-containing protein [Pseudomonas sp. Marseille-Q1929]|uniref:dermonecrotic toxin domain-containing protein n=1 Tax=Pseudomonas sp. Marseille-Q1929 TaxID=2730402 RepID=UPI001A8E2BB1|nr:DUF6543 domain-containing protein [Pseudomonas sp. Marseille-Q1929]MBO0491987.1 hypothetical protein [Pseudomonas sp. Marseille-Q1929]
MIRSLSNDHHSTTPPLGGQLPFNPVMSNTPKALESQASTEPSATSPGDKKLVEAYIAAVQKKILHNDPGLIKVPPDSQLGQWLELYREHLENPVVKNWMRDHGIQMDAASINPSTGVLTYGEGDKQKTFTLTDNSGWGQIAGPILDTAKVISPVPGKRLRVNMNGDEVVVRPKLVTDFYGETLPTSKSEARAQVRRLEHNDHAFRPIPADDSLRPANSRSADALQTQKLNAAKFFLTAPQALAYKHLAVDVANNLPNTRAEAKKWADAVLFKLTGKHIDSDTVYLNRFNGGGHTPDPENATITGWEYTTWEPVSSLRLPDALLKNFSEDDGVPGNLDWASGLYTDGFGQSKKKGWGAHNQVPILPSQVMHESWKTDFQGEMTKKIDTFWNSHNDDYRTAIKGEFTYQARKQLKTAEARLTAERALQAPEHRFTREDYRLVMGAVSNLPLDPNAPLSVEQLKAQAPAKDHVQAHALNIAGFASNDILRFSAADGGRQVLYIPGAEPAFLRFDSLEKLNQWVIDQTKDDKKRAALASHFPLIARQDHEPGTLASIAKIVVPLLWFTNVGSRKEGLDTVFQKLASGKLHPAIHENQSPIAGDVFSAMAAASKDRMTSDADVVIKSNSEVTRDTWLNDVTVAAGLLAKLAPIAAPVAAAAVVTGLTELALGAEKQASGDTVAERRDGSSKAFDGLLNTLFSVGASAVPEDPFALPPERELPPVKPQPQPEVTVSKEPQPGPSHGIAPETKPAPTPLPRSPSLLPMAQYAVADGEQLIKNATRDASGVYRMTDSTGAFRQFVRMTDETGTSKVFEISGSYRSGAAAAKIIDPTTRTGLTVVTPGRDGEWARAPGDGGAWWSRKASTSPSPEPKLSPKLSDEFLDINGEKMKGSETLDKYLKVDGNEYKYGITLNNEGETIPQLSWTAEEDPLKATLPPSDFISTFGTNDYTHQFLTDLHRSKFTVEAPGGTLKIDIDQQIKALKQQKGRVLTNDELDDVKRENIRAMEEMIPDPELRRRISQLANQWALGAASDEFSASRFEGTVFGSGRDPHYHIKYDPANNVTTVTAKSDYILTKLDNSNGELEELNDIEVTSSRTLTLRESNELDSDGYALDPSSPIRMEVRPKLS